MGQASWSVAVMHRKMLRPPLLLLLLAEAPGHGYALSDRLIELGLEVPTVGSVYHDLRALERDGLVQSHWSPPSSGPLPRVYELTAAGVDALEACAQDIAALEQVVQSFASRYGGLGATAATHVDRELVG